MQFGDQEKSPLTPGTLIRFVSIREMHLPLRRRLQRNRVLFLLAMVLAFSIYQLLRGPKIRSAPWTASQPEDQVKVTTRDLSSNKAVAVDNGTTASKIRHCVYVDPTPTISITSSANATPSLGSVNLTHLDEEGSYPTPPSHGEYPEDLFSLEERRKGWVILHIFGMMYVFVALAIVCDEYFVPALDVITEKLQISDDVAGATFMAAGGSAPELFTSLIGVFISHSNVGIGTIVGSAVFNILFVIGTCALFSREILHLTWWPLFRDVSFYILDLLMLILFFLDSFIVWWESILLLSAYILYVLTMKWNVHLEQWVKEQVNKTRNPMKVAASEDTKKQGNGSVARDGAKHSDDSKRLELMPSLPQGGSSASLHNSHMRTTIFQLMIRTLDPLAEENKAEAELATTVQVTPASDSNLSVVEDEHNVDTPPGGQLSLDIEGSSSEEEEDCDEESEDEDEEEENDEPLSLEWPETRRKQALYLFLLPVVFPLWLTVPDVRNPRSRNFFAITFLGAIIWIAAFSYLMVWWAHQVGETIGISEEIMGLTILAAGTSIPDLITSVIVARKGLGDMAVSSSVGSNIFDITVGLPVPWFLYSVFNGLSSVAVSSNGLFCAIVLLFLMLLFVIISIALSKWKMNKLLGLTMFALYFVFLIISVMLEERIISCPISV
ncbi:sodium/potassium/calcium exchanger 1 [Trachemys scripta elegans]|uniref:sodium/potassium/calcium exchanger 1 n=1 Tax=Trachemys scripta elegans TaxID=31138 RepID=UPI0015542845|nr:sodium/potassium/calcium exchanger 1 [Trachemys scripta elegans]XP_034639761.1 sodium/potassium/calcium exchanger 1 [Trachemys scripta elegans]